MVQTSTWLLTAQPGSLPRILQQPLRLGWGFSRPGPCAGPGDLIVLKHSSYRQIFQCPLSLVSDLHICWNTVGCLLCSSDQLGISLVLRGSGLRSHLSCCHLPISYIFLYMYKCIYIYVYLIYLFYLIDLFIFNVYLCIHIYDGTCIYIHIYTHIKISLFIHPSNLNQWTCRLVLSLGYCKGRCKEHGGAYVFSS